MNPYWQFYDRLIALASNEEIIRNIYINPSWTFVLTDTDHIGVAMTQQGQPFDVNAMIGMKLRDAAQLIKSWNFAQASIGLAAINATINRRELFPPQENPDAFLRYKDRFLGKKVVVVGHFAYLEKRLEGLCDLAVLERCPTGNDIPDPACEYLLPETDVVVITGSAIVNKTMPRLLDLSQNAFTIISGPSTPMTDVLFDYGVNSACGFCATDSGVFSAPNVREALSRACSSIFGYGEMVCAEHFPQ